MSQLRPAPNRFNGPAEINVNLGDGAPVPLSSVLEQPTPAAPAPVAPTPAAFSEVFATLDRIEATLSGIEQRTAFIVATIRGDKIEDEDKPLEPVPTPAGEVAT